MTQTGDGEQKILFTELTLVVPDLTRLESRGPAENSAYE